MGPLKRLGPFGYSIYVDGRDVGMSFPTAADARENAANLTRMDYDTIAVVDRWSGETVENVRLARRLN